MNATLAPVTTSTAPGTRLVVRTQAELDAALAAPVREDTVVAMRGTECFRLDADTGHRVEAVGSTIVTVGGSATLTAGRNSMVSATGYSTVFALGQADVSAPGRATVHLLSIWAFARACQEATVVRSGALDSWPPDRTAARPPTRKGHSEGSTPSAGTQAGPPGFTLPPHHPPPQKEPPMSKTVLTLAGNLTADPELRVTASGQAVVSFTVASTPRTFNKQTSDWVDGETLFMRCTAWAGLAQNVTDSVRKGNRVLVTGELKSRTYETTAGEKKTVVELTCDDVAASMVNATVTAQKATSTRTGGQGAPQQAAQPAATAAPLVGGAWGGAGLGDAPF